MELRQIEERISKKETQIAKIEKRIAKWEAAISEKGFKKEYEWLAQDGFYYNRESGKYDYPYESFKLDRWDDYEKNCKSEIKRANNDLEEAKIQLTKYFNQLEFEKAKQDRLNGDRIQVIVDFLENWKIQVTEYIRKNVNVLIDYYAKDSEACNYWNSCRATDPNFKEKYNALRKEAANLKSMVNPLTFEVYDRYSDTKIDELKLKNILGKEADEKYLSMIDSITSKVGSITDANSLNIGPKGDIEGYITGTDGKVHIETIGAGGYNIQCYHFRTLIKPIKEA